MKKKRTWLIDPYEKAMLYMMESESDAKPITVVAAAVAAKGLTSMSSALRRIENMIEEGYLSEKGVFEKRYVSITEKGKRVIEHLKAIDEIMEE